MKIFLLRWNPAISSWKDADFREALAKSREGPVAMDWSVREWEKLEEWDWAVLCRVGEVKGPVPITPTALMIGCSIRPRALLLYFSRKL